MTLTVAVSSAVMVAVLLSIQRLRAQGLMAENARQQIEQLDNTLAMADDNLEGFVRDEAYWNDMVQFIAHPDAGWADNSITQSLPTFGANAAWVFRMDDSQVYSATDTSAAGKPLAGLAMPGWRSSFGDARSAHFYLNTPAGLAEVWGATVHPNGDPEGLSEPAGYIYAARVWTPAYVAMLANASGAQLKLSPAAGREKSRDRLDVRTGAITLTRTLNGDSGKPRAVLTAGYVYVGMPVYNGTSQLMTLLFFIYSLLTLSVLFWRLDRWVTRPLQLVTDGLLTENPHSIERLARNPTEFGRIGQLMREFVDQRVRLVEEVSQREKIQAELRKTNGQLAATNERLVASDRQRRELFDLVVMHDFGTPLTVMQGYLDLLSDGLFGELSEGQHKVVATIAARLKELNSVRDRMLEASGLDSGSVTLAPEIVDMGVLVRTSIRAIEGYARDREVELTSRVPEVKVCCDPRRIQQAVDNFLLSALKYAGSAQRLEVSAQISGPELFLWFRDKGTGTRPIDPALAESGPDLRFATGIELALARAIVGAHHGRIFVESRNRHALSIGFSVPLLANPAAQHESGAAPEMLPPGMRYSLAAPRGV
jgi:signal transduction histidine kinase